jgi:hypothetical protein
MRLSKNWGVFVLVEVGACLRGLCTNSRFGYASIRHQAIGSTLPKSIFDRLPHQPGLETREFKLPSGALGRIPKDHRTSLIRVDWVDMSSFQEKQKFAKDTSRGVSNGLATDCRTHP